MGDKKFDDAMHQVVRWFDGEGYHPEDPPMTVEEMKKLKDKKAEEELRAEKKMEREERAAMITALSKIGQPAAAAPAPDMSAMFMAQIAAVFMFSELPSFQDLSGF